MGLPNGHRFNLTPDSTSPHSKFYLKLRNLCRIILDQRSLKEREITRRGEKEEKKKEKEEEEEEKDEREREGKKRDETL